MPSDRTLALLYNGRAWQARGERISAHRSCSTQLPLVEQFTTLVAFGGLTQELEPLLLIGRAGANLHDADKDRHLGAIDLAGVVQAGFTDPPDLPDIKVEDRVRVCFPIDQAQDRERIAVLISENDIADGGEFLNLGNARDHKTLFGDELLGQIGGKRFARNLRLTETRFFRIGQVHWKFS